MKYFGILVLQILRRQALLSILMQNGPAYFTNPFLHLCSSVPFLGGIVVGAFDIESTVSSAVLVTDLYQARSNMHSGLGTSLIGDLYNTAKLPWVMFYLAILGYFLSDSYRKAYEGKTIGAYQLFIYVLLFSDSLYMMRSEWYSLFRYMGFTIIIFVVLKLIFFKNEKSKKNSIYSS